MLGIIPGVVEGQNPHEAALAVFEWMRGEMTYMKGSTGVTTNAEEAWSQRQGVCQDLAHLAIGALRSCGIPARYVSGYLHPRSTADIGETVAGQSHAWLEWWDGEWRSWDPTNHKPAGDFHVTVARGRDYRDVPPLKGILSGGGGSALNVSVEITRPVPRPGSGALCSESLRGGTSARLHPLSWVHHVSGAVTLNRRPVSESGRDPDEVVFWPACQGNR